MPIHRIAMAASMALCLGASVQAQAPDTPQRSLGMVTVTGNSARSAVHADGILLSNYL